MGAGIFLSVESDIFVLPRLGRGRMEGCPVALLEAMACAKACVATDIPGSHDLIEHAKSGLLVQPEDPQQMAQNLNGLIQDVEKCHLLGQSARLQMEGRFTVELEVARHETLYNEFLYS